MQVFIKELLMRGHEVTCITSIKLSGHKYENYTEILIDPPYDMQNISKWNNDVENVIMIKKKFWRESCMKWNNKIKIKWIMKSNDKQIEWVKWINEKKINLPWKFPMEISEFYSNLFNEMSMCFEFQLN